MSNGGAILIAFLLIFSPDIWRRLLKPIFEELSKIFKNRNT